MGTEIVNAHVVSIGQMKIVFQTKRGGRIIVFVLAVKQVVHVPPPNKFLQRTATALSGSVVASSFVLARLLPLKNSVSRLKRRRYVTNNDTVALL